MKPEERAAERIKHYADAIFEFESSEAERIISEEFEGERAMSKKLLEALKKANTCRASMNSDVVAVIDRTIAEANEVKT